MDSQTSQCPFVQCSDCSFITSTQGHLGIHRPKMHNVDIPDHVKTVSIVRLFPQRKSFYCCLCDNIIASFPNFKRHFKTKHKGISLKISAKCMLCDQVFTDSHSAGVHLQRTHHIGKDDTHPVPPSPIMSFVDLTDEANNATMTRSNRRRRIKTSLESSVSSLCDITSPVSNIVQDEPTTECVTTVNDNLDHSPSHPMSPINPQNDHSSSPQLSLSQPTSHPHQSTPKPVLTDLNIDDDLESITSPPPRPILTCPSLQPSLEPVVALIDCTAGNRDLHNPHPDPSSSSIYQTTLTHRIHNPPIPVNSGSPEPMVTLNGCTVVDDDYSTNQSSQSPPTSPYSLSTSPHHKYPLLSHLLPRTSLFHLFHPLLPLSPLNIEFPESMVALNGCTDVDGAYNSDNSSQPPFTAPSSFPTSPSSQDPFIVPPPIFEIVK